MAISAKHIKFITLVAKGTSYQDAYTITSHNKTITNATARAQGSILAKKYKLEIQQEKEKDAQVVTIANNKDTARNALKSVIDQAAVDAKLFKILGEDDSVDDIYYKNGKPTHFTRKPTQAELQKSADLYYKRFGSFSATKSNVVITSVGKDAIEETYE